MKEKNHYRVDGDMVIMELNQRNGGIIETYFDLDDLEKVTGFKYRWLASWRENSHAYYVQTTIYLGTFDGKPKYTTKYLHKYLMGEPEGMVVDHIDNNPLNNCKSNLRVITVKENLQNRRSANLNNSTGVRNVSYSNADNKYIVQLYIEGKNIIFGKYNDLKEAEKCAIENRKKFYIN